MNPERILRRVLLGAAVVGLACGGGGPSAMPDAATPDAAVTDASTPDAAVPDATVPDAAVPDAAVPDAAAPDVRAPEAVLVVPADGAEGVRGDVVITVVFDEALRPSSLMDGAVRVLADGATVDGVAALEDRLLTFTPTTSLAPGAEIGVRIEASLADLAGNALAAPVVFGFAVSTTTAGLDDIAPTVIETTPADGAVDAARRDAVRVRLSELLDPASVGADALTLQVDGAELPGLARYEGDALVFLAAAPLPAGARVEARLAGAVADLAGNTLGADFVFTFDTVGPIAGLIVGGRRACAISSVGELSCWGAREGPAEPIVKSVIGERYARGSARTDGALLLIDDDGRLLYLGGDYGWLPHASWPTPVDERRWRSVAAGPEGACAITVDGTLHCSPSFFASPAPGAVLEQLGERDDWLSVSVGEAQGCGVRAGGRLYCWGSGGASLGTGDTSDAPLPVEIGLDRSWSQVTMGSEASCAIATDGTLHCWGVTASFEIPFADEEERLAPARVGERTDWVQVALSQQLGCALDSAGAIFCWNNLTGQPSMPDRARVSVPTRVDATAGFRELGVGDRFACALRGDDAVLCFGANDANQLGTVRVVFDQPPTMIGSETTWSSVIAGSGNACALREDGSAACWGRGDLGQLGTGRFTHESTPTDIPGRYRMLAGYEANVCAIDMTGALVCWGGGGVTGLASTEHQASPVTLAVGTDWLDVSIGGGQVQALRSDGTRWGFGSGDEGKLGHGGRGGFTVPQQMDTRLDWAQVSAGRGQSCGVVEAGQLFCWGRIYGVEPLTSVIARAPVEVGLGRLWQRASANDRPTVALDSAGVAHSIGGGSGDGTGDIVTEFTALPGGPWVRVANGYDNVCLIDAAGVASCWGPHAGTVAGSSPLSPAPLAIGPVRDVAHGENASVAVDIDGRLWTWGSGPSGELGRGQPFRRTLEEVDLGG